MAIDAAYKDDAFGRRIEKTVDGHTTVFLWQGERLIVESGDNRCRTYVYEPDSFRPLAMLDGEGPLKATPFYYQLDHLGTLRSNSPPNRAPPLSSKQSLKIVLLTVMVMFWVLRLLRSHHWCTDLPARMTPSYP